MSVVEHEDSAAKKGWGKISRLVKGDFLDGEGRLGQGEAGKEGGQGS